MTVEQRKIELIKWITTLSDGSLLDRMDDLKMAATQEVPKEILQMLELSANVDRSELVEHTSVKDLLKKQ